MRCQHVRSGSATILDDVFRADKELRKVARRLCKLEQELKSQTADEGWSTYLKLEELSTQRLCRMVAIAADEGFERMRSLSLLKPQDGSQRARAQAGWLLDSKKQGPRNHASNRLNPATLRFSRSRTSERMLESSPNGRSK